MVDVVQRTVRPDDGKVAPYGMTKHDISVEMWREYVIITGNQVNAFYKIEFPLTVYIKKYPDGDSHRVVDVDGVVHYIPRGWKVLRWKVKPGHPDVLF